MVSAHHCSMVSASQLAMPSHPDDGNVDTGNSSSFASQHSPPTSWTRRSVTVEKTAQTAGATAAAAAGASICSPSLSCISLHTSDVEGLEMSSDLSAVMASVQARVASGEGRGLPPNGVNRVQREHDRLPHPRMYIATPPPDDVDAFSVASGPNSDITGFRSARPEERPAAADQRVSRWVEEASQERRQVPSTASSAGPAQASIEGVLAPAQQVCQRSRHPPTRCTQPL